MGKWTGTVKVGRTESCSTFEIFDCGNVFNVILGKPWLRQMRAIHNYETDHILLRGPKITETIVNQSDDSGRRTAPELAASTITPITQHDPETNDDAAVTPDAEAQPQPKRGWRRQDVYEEEKALQEREQTEEGMRT